MTFGEINIKIWVVLFVVILFYEILAVKVVLAIEKLQSILVANLSVMLGLMGMGCVVLYTEDINNMIPILTATWLGNFYIVEHEKKKKKNKKEDDGFTQ